MFFTMKLPMMLIFVWLGGRFRLGSQCSALVPLFSGMRWGQCGAHSKMMPQTRMWLYDERPRRAGRHNHKRGGKQPFSPVRRKIQQTRTIEEIENYMNNLFSKANQGPLQFISLREEVELIRLLGRRRAYHAVLRLLHFSRRKKSLYAPAISALSQSHSSAIRSKALHLLDEMDTQGKRPTSHTLTALFLCVDGSRATTKLFERIQRYESAEVVHVYNAAIIACSRVPANERFRASRVPPNGWQTALSIFFQMKKAGVAPNVRTYGTLLHACAQSGQVRIALSLLDEMRNRGLKPNEKVWGAVMNACAKAGDYQQAIRLLSQMQLDGAKPNTRHLSSLLSALAKDGKDELALDVLEGMQQNREITISFNHTTLSLWPAPPDLVALNTVLFAFAKAGNYEGAKMLLERMKTGDFATPNSYFDPRQQNYQNHQIRPDEISYNTVLSSCRDSQEAKSLVKEMRMSRRHRYESTPPSSITYVHAITACRKSHVPDLESALFLLESAQNDGIEPNVFMYSAAIWTAERIGDAESALAILNEMKSESATKRGCTPNAISYDGVMSCLASSGRGQDAVELFEEMKDSGIAPTPITYKRLVTAISNSNTTGHKIDALERVVRRMDARGRQAEVGGPVIEALIRAYASEPDGYHDAKRLFNIIEGPVNGACLCAIMYACTKARPSQWEDAVSILHSSDIVTGAVGPARIDARALSYAILACAREDEWEEGINLLHLYGLPLKQQRSGDFKLQTVALQVFNALISACGRGGRPDVSLRVLNEMESIYGVSPDSRSYRSAVIACNQAEHEKRRRRTRITESSNFTNEEVSTGSCTTDDSSLQWWECALSLLRRMKEANLEPDPQTYSSVISACEAAGQWQRALGVLRSMTETKDPGNSAQPNLYCFNSAISACEKGGAWLEALELYERMKERGGTVRPNSVTLNSLLVALDNAGQKELAQSTYDEGVREGIVSPWKKTSGKNGVQIRAMDLHSFSTAMTNAAIRSVLHSLLTANPAHDISEELVIIVGKGKGSEGNKPVLLPAVQQLLTEEFGIECRIDASNIGRLVIEPASLQSYIERNQWREFK